MDQFKGFSEAALLYAENVVVVDQMRLLFRGEVDAFLDSVRSAVRKAKPNFREQITNGGRFRYWWISPAGTTNSDNPRIWFDTTDPDIVTRRVLSCMLLAQKVTDEEQHALVSIATSGNSWTTRETKGLGPEHLIVIELNYKPLNPVESLVEMVTDCLQKIRDEHIKFPIAANQ